MKKHKTKGFTLVELIVVLVILAVLAAILVPALLGWIDRARKSKYLLEARNVVMAAQARASEAYAAQEKPEEFTASDDIKEVILTTADSQGKINGWKADTYIVSWLEYEAEDETVVTYCTDWQDYSNLTGIYTVDEKISPDGSGNDGSGDDSGGSSGDDSGNDDSNNTSNGSGSSTGFNTDSVAEKLSNTNWTDFFSTGWISGTTAKNESFLYKIYEADGKKYGIVLGQKGVDDTDPAIIAIFPEDTVDSYCVVNKADPSKGNPGTWKTSELREKLSSRIDPTHPLDSITYTLGDSPSITAVGFSD